MVSRVAGGRSPTLAVREIGSFHIGGSTMALRGLSPRLLTVVPGSPTLSVEQDGDFPAWSMYAQYIHLAEPRWPWRLLLWHGGGMTGAAWETTPDRRPGWQAHFLSEGFDTYVSDAVERGRAGWARYPEISGTEPFFLSKQAAWKLFRIGPVDGYASGVEERRPFEGTLFPTGAFDAFAKQIVPRWTGNEAHIQAAYDALLDEVGPSVIVAHSQGAGFAIAAALRAPHLVKAVVLVEPGGTPNPRLTDLGPLVQVPILVVWGDRTDDVPFWARAKERAVAFATALRALGGDIGQIDLPREGHYGNSHMIMMDRNSAEVATLVTAWLVGRLPRK